MRKLILACIALTVACGCNNSLKDNHDANRAEQTDKANKMIEDETGDE